MLNVLLLMRSDVIRIYNLRTHQWQDVGAKRWFFCFVAVYILSVNGFSIQNRFFHTANRVIRLMLDVLFDRECIKILSINVHSSYSKVYFKKHFKHNFGRLYDMTSISN